MVRIEDINALYSKQQLNLEIELILNRNLYNNNKISEDTYSKIETTILKDINA